MADVIDLRASSGTRLVEDAGQAHRACHASNDVLTATATEAVLAYEDREGALPLSVEDAAELLATRLRRHLLVLDGRVFLGRAPRSVVESLATVDEPGGSTPRLEAGFAAYLDELGERGAKAASTVRKRARERLARVDTAPETYFRLWLPSEQGAPPFLHILAEVVLYTEGVEQVERRAKLKAPAIPGAVLDQLLDLRSATPSPDGRSFTAAGSPIVFAPRRPPNEDRDQRLDAGIRVLRESADAERLWRMLLRDGFDHRDNDQLVYQGGARAMVTRGGVAESRSRVALDVLEALHALRGPDSKGAAYLHAFEVQPASPRGPAVVRVELGDPLRGGYVTRLSGPRARRLLPVLSPPDASFAPSHQIVQAFALQWELLAEMREAKPLKRGLPLSPAALARRAERAGAAPRLAERALAAWVGSDGWLDRRDGLLYLRDEGAEALIYDDAPRAQRHRAARGIRPKKPP